MAARSFRDEAGVEWTVWAVRPQMGERRLGSERRSGQDRRADPRRTRAGGRPDRRRVPDRRVAPRSRVTLMPGYEHGWLAFEAGHERRRLVPIPPDWEACDARALEAYCRRAALTRPATRSA